MNTKVEFNGFKVESDEGIDKVILLFDRLNGTKQEVPTIKMEQPTGAVSENELKLQEEVLILEAQIQHLTEEIIGAKLLEIKQLTKNNKDLLNQNKTLKETIDTMKVSSANNEKKKAPSIGIPTPPKAIIRAQEVIEAPIVIPKEEEFAFKAQDFDPTNESDKAKLIADLKDVVPPSVPINTNLSPTEIVDGYVITRDERGAIDTIAGIKLSVQEKLMLEVKVVTVAKTFANNQAANKDKIVSGW